MNKAIGIDIGYSSLKISVINQENDIIHNFYQFHKGKIKETLLQALDELSAKMKLKDIKYGAFTGTGSKFLEKHNFKHVNEVAAIVEGAQFVCPETGSIIEIGGQTSKFITGVSQNDKRDLKISMNSGCSAGTGSFLEELTSRMDINIEDYFSIARKGKKLLRIAGRCGVFAKTDITHHQQEGASREDILMSLSYSLLRNYKAAVMKKLPLNPRTIFIGGVAYNHSIVETLPNILKIKPSELIVPRYFSTLHSIGTALRAKESKYEMDLEKLIDIINHIKPNETLNLDDKIFSPLPQPKTMDNIEVYVEREMDEETSYYLGVDVGSTSTNLVLMDDDGNIVSSKYLRTLGEPLRTARKGLLELKEEIPGLKIKGAGVTGSGRYLIGDYIGADEIIDEITAQAKAAINYSKDVDTVFEIGGQDSKFILLKNGNVVDFQMNKICAAGTGSFIEEQAKKFNIPLEKIGPLALLSQAPANLGDRCAVFIESSIACHLAAGVPMEDILAGLCYSVVNNYLNRVVGAKAIGNKIVLQGGLAFNPGVVQAFRAITQKEVLIPPHFHVTGAWGAALTCLENKGQHEKSKFKGFDIPITSSQEIKHSILHEKYNKEFNKIINEVVFKEYHPERDPNKKTVGIPRALFTFGMFAMFNAFFKSLGLNVILSDPTDERTLELGKEYSLDETCFPIKLINGHVAELIEKKVDYVFFPDLYTVDHPDSPSRQNYGCAYMQLAFKIINQAMDLKKRNIQLLAPTIAFNMGKEFNMKSFAKIGSQLGKTPEESFQGLKKGMIAFQAFEKRLSQEGEKEVSQIKNDERVFVLISKIYGIADPVLNLSVPGKIRAMGYKTLPFFYLPEGDLELDYPNMFWPFGQHILEPAKLVKEHPNYYAVFLTHHCCGPDSVLQHYFKEIMGNKPYLNIEVDEHSSEVGIMTRLEAFINSVKNIPTIPALPMDHYVKKIKHKIPRIITSKELIKTRSPVYLPYLYPYSELISQMYLQKGINLQSLPPTDQESIKLGREFITTNEYYTLTGLIGDVIKQTRKTRNNCYYIPRLEGAETDGQYARLIRYFLNKEGRQDTEIYSPFMEDFIQFDSKRLIDFFLCLLSGDMILLATPEKRHEWEKEIIHLIKSGNFRLEKIIEIAKRIDVENSHFQGKTLLTVGDPMIVFNSIMNDHTLREMESPDRKIVRMPFSEYMWMFWFDHFNNHHPDVSEGLFDKLHEMMDKVSRRLSSIQPFSQRKNLVETADRQVGFYSGTNGRYRFAKANDKEIKMDGILTLSSTYENTGISLNILQKNNTSKTDSPILDLTFDGNKNENDEVKIKSFLYYL